MGRSSTTLCRRGLKSSFSADFRTPAEDERSRKSLRRLGHFEANFLFLREFRNKKQSSGVHTSEGAMAPNLQLAVHRGGVVNGNGTNGKKKRRRLIIWVSVIAVIVLLIAGGVFAATRGGTKIDPSKLAKVEKGDLAKSVVATGKVTPITKVEVKSKASGIVKKLYVEAGDKVKKGQLLAQLDKEEIQAQVAQSEDRKSTRLNSSHAN